MLKSSCCCMNYRFAITREPGQSFNKCLSDHPLKFDIHIGKARRQHMKYREILGSLGLQIINLPRDDLLPDSCFVEDTVVVHKRKAFVTRMGVENRRGESHAIEEILKTYHLQISRAVDPATVEGGDVIHLNDRLICGITQRTNIEGVRQMSKWLNVRVDTITNPNMMHLKSYVTFLDKKTMLVTSDVVNHPILEPFRKIVVPDHEKYAANSLTINNVVLMAETRPNSIELVREAGFEVIPVDVSEFEKCDGALTCLSVLF